ncbi:Hsp20/alpha crystallin family protein [Metabacillus mangrovi]|nr:Hsp20/alpha crystallin family protein [Metabacillus mangrovi]
MKKKNENGTPDLGGFNRELSDVVDAFFQSSPIKHFLKQFEELFLQNAEFPYMEIHTRELEEEVLVEASIPAASMEDLDIDITGRTLTIELDHKVFSGADSGRQSIQSTTYSRFSRSVLLPADVNDQMMLTALHDGKLIIRIPKK